MSKFQNKYRIPSARAQWWDYAWSGAYFITICTAGRGHFLGEIKNEKMVLSPMGAIADVLWHEIPKHFKTARLGNFVVMPNHVHGILILNPAWGQDSGDKVDAANVETGHALSLQKMLSENSTYKKFTGSNRFQNIGKNTVSSIIGAYKSAVTKHANRLGLEHAWQARFYDNIIRDERAYQYISAYIANNPRNWPEDKFYSE